MVASVVISKSVVPQGLWQRHGGHASSTTPANIWLQEPTLQLWVVSAAVMSLRDALASEKSEPVTRNQSRSWLWTSFWPEVTSVAQVCPYSVRSKNTFGKHQLT